MSFIIDFLKAVGGICRTEPLDPAAWDVRDSKIFIALKDAPALQTPGGAVRLDGKGLSRSVLVVNRPADGYVCVENRCTHMGRKLDPEPDGQTLRCCSVNHSTFDYQGNKLTGPAKGPVRVYRHEEKEGNLIIDIA
jgi:nitrite reductase/ring-hydroxylating ferredoxin subunit